MKPYLALLKVPGRGSPGEEPTYCLADDGGFVMASTRYHHSEMLAYAALRPRHDMDKEESDENLWWDGRNYRLGDEIATHKSTQIPP
ncbi:MAG: hypothetical protein QME92_05490 [Bacillota bacterium]|nr:hypothetical protein [Bacillota bacterium]